MGQSSIRPESGRSVSSRAQRRLGRFASPFVDARTQRVRLAACRSFYRIKTECADKLVLISGFRGVLLRKLEIKTSLRLRDKVASPRTQVQTHATRSNFHAPVFTGLRFRKRPFRTVRHDVFSADFAGDSFSLSEHFFTRCR